jgi:hypothetical protein
MRFGAVAVFYFRASSRGPSGHAYEIRAHVSSFEKSRGAVRFGVEEHEIAETFWKFELTPGGVKKALPGLCFAVQAASEFTGADVALKHRGETEVEESRHVVDKAISNSLVRRSLTRVAEFCSLVELAHGFK